MSTSQDVLFEERDTASGQKLGIVTLNVEKTLNSLNLGMVEAMLTQLAEWRDRRDIACLFITAAGEKAFCAGGDVQALYRSATETPGGPCEYAERFFEQEYRLDYALHQFAKPVVVWGHGIVMGGGLGIFAAGSYRVVTEKSRLAMPEITIAANTSSRRLFSIKLSAKPRYRASRPLKDAPVSARKRPQWPGMRLRK